MKNPSSHQIGAVAAATGLSIHTIRYYEKLGLIERPERSSGGFRMYSDSIIEKILFIKKAQSFGLTLEEISKIMICSHKGLHPCCSMITEIFTEKINEFETKIKDLQKMKRRLKRLVSGWSAK